MRSWRIVAGLAVVALVVQCYGLYRVTGPPTPPWFPNADKLEHLVGFGAPAFLVLLALALRRRSYGWPPSRVEVVGVVAVFVVHAVLSEVIQHLFYVTRSGDPLDALADTTGVGLAVLGRWLVQRRLDRVRSAARSVSREPA